MDTLRFDHVVIGSGLAGLTFALRAAEYGGKVCVLTKAELSDSNTQYAQGGIAAAVGEADSWKLHEEDTLIAGAGLCDPQAVRFLVQRAPKAIEWLQSLGARFDFATGGDLALGREGGHSRNRIVHHQDRTGWEVERAMTEAVRSNENITIFERAFVTSLLVEDGRCAGALAYIEPLGRRAVLGRTVLLATGGCGRMYQHTTNPSVATGDGVALASRIGAEIRGMEFMQFHPTTLYHPQLRSFLISEAARGAGGTLRNHLGHRFMFDFDERLELAPRDIVARAIDSEMKRLETWCVYLDLAHLPAHALKEEFPTIFSKLESVGILMDRDWIPVVPAQHYSCGGVVADLDGQTTIPGLFAAGEVACTGVHGANRLASNSLLEALIFASAAAEATSTERLASSAPPLPQEPICIAESEAIRIRRALQKVMTAKVGIVRTNAGLREALRAVDRLITDYESQAQTPFSTYPLETHNLLIAARHVVAGALARKESVGLHFNEDLPSLEVPSTGAVPPLQVAAAIPQAE